MPSPREAGAEAEGRAPSLGPHGLLSRSSPGRGGFASKKNMQRHIPFRIAPALPALGSAKKINSRLSRHRAKDCLQHSTPCFHVGAMLD